MKKKYEHALIEITWLNAISVLELSTDGIPDNPFDDGFDM